MKHINAIPGFEYVRPIVEKGQLTKAVVAGDYFQISDCVHREGGVYEGVVVHHLKNTHLHGLQSDDRITFTPPEIDPHALVQEQYGLQDKLMDYPTAIDEHVETCEECRERVIGFTRWLPKLHARMTVQFPESVSYDEQLKQLKRGQCLPCGCEVTDTTWTQEQASNAFYTALAEILQVTDENARKVPAWTKLLDLPLDTKSLRRLRDKFWFPDGSSMSEELRDKEEGNKVRQLPETVGQFITEILDMHSGMSYSECSDHWSPP